MGEELMKQVKTNRVFYQEGYAQAKLDSELDSKREPLSEATIAKLWLEAYLGTTQMVRNFARAIEKHHGITGVDDETV